MSPMEMLFACGIASCFAVLVLYVVFARVALRILKNIPELQDELGPWFAGGLNALNVAEALALPEFLMGRSRKSPLSLFVADAKIIKEHVPFPERILACMFFWLFMLTCLFFLALLIIDKVFT